MRKGDTGYVLKYALTQGVFKARVVDVTDYVYVRRGSYDLQCQKHEVATTLAEARPIVTAMARNKIESHNRSLDKLRKTLEIWVRAKDTDLPVKDEP